MDVSALGPLSWDRPSPPRIKQLELLGEGDFCVCYLANGTHVLRLAKHAEASAAVDREAILLPHLEGRLPVEIPRIEHTGTRLVTGDRFQLYRLVPGEPVGPETVRGLDPPTRERLVAQMAELAAALHRVPVDVARACGLVALDHRRYLPDLLARAGPVLAHRLGPEVWRYYELLVEAYLDDTDSGASSPSLLHGDLSPGHFLIDASGKLSGVIDFGDAFIGDPHRDLIFVLEDFGRDVLDLFLDHYAASPKEQAIGRITRLQQLENVAYCLAMARRTDERATVEALETLTLQATMEPLL